MRDFTYYAPTEVAFGKGAEQRLGKLLKRYGATKVLVHYGGGSAERSGLLAVVREQITGAGMQFVELGGVVPNPRVSKVREGIEICRQAVIPEARKERVDRRIKS